MHVIQHNEIEFHNAAALETFCGMQGVCPVRVPRAVRETLNPGAKATAMAAAGVELRFVGPERVRIAMEAHQEEVTLFAYRGEFGCGEWRIPAGMRRVIELNTPDRFSWADAAVLSEGAFSPDVWRIQISNGVVGFLGVETLGGALRPPLPEEKPALRWLAYGSSITHSFGKGYPHQAARRLGVDVLNKGLSGSCHCEEQLAVHFAGAESWDFATLELGVNMRGVFTPEAFEERAVTFVDRLRAARPDAPLVLITHFRNRDHFPPADRAEAVAPAHQQAYDEILRRLAAERADDRVFLLEGMEILRDLTGLTADLLHPSDYGHVQMGENLAAGLRRCLGDLLELRG